MPLELSFDRSAAAAAASLPRSIDQPISFVQRSFSLASASSRPQHAQIRIQASDATGAEAAVAHRGQLLTRTCCSLALSLLEQLSSTQLRSVSSSLHSLTLLSFSITSAQSHGLEVSGIEAAVQGEQAAAAAATGRRHEASSLCSSPLFLSCSPLSISFDFTFRRFFVLAISIALIVREANEAAEALRCQLRRAP